MKEYWLRRLKVEVEVKTINDVRTSLWVIKEELEPNDSVKLVLKGDRRLSVLSDLPKELRKMDFSLIWADEGLDEIVAYAVYKPTSLSKMGLKELPP